MHGEKHIKKAGNMKWGPRRNKIGDTQKREKIYGEATYMDNVIGWRLGLGPVEGL